MPTFQRQASLRRLLDSLPEGYTVLVIHDGDEPAPDEIAPAIGAFESGTNAVHIGSRRKARYLERLRSAANARDCRASQRLELALGTGPGCVRNWILLLNAGRPFISIDDDQLWLFREFSQESLTSSSMRCVAYTDDVARLIERSIPYTQDPVEALLTALEESTFQGGPVFAAMTGVYGGRWFSRPHGVLLASENYHRFSYARHKRYLRMKSNPVAALQSRETTISRSGYFATGCCSMDARQQLPPFAPNSRPEDTFWATLATALIPGSGVAYLPFAIYHDPEGKPPFTEHEYTVVEPDFGLLNLIILRDILTQMPACDELSAYRVAAERLFQISALEYSQWSDYLHELWLKHIGNMILDAENALETRRGRPPWWAKDLRAYISAARKQATNWPSSHLYSDHRAYLKRYGELLEVWPDIWLAAIELNDYDDGLTS